MKNYRYLKTLFSLLFVSILLTACEQDLESPISNFVGFEIGAPERGIDVPKDQSQSFDIKVYASETRSSDRTFNVLVDMESTTLSSPYSVPSTVTIPGGSNEGTLSFTITDNDDLGFEKQLLVIGFEEFDNNNVTFAVTEQCLNTVVTLNLELDTWPDETTWELYDLNGTPSVIGSGGPYNNPEDDFAVLAFDFCLEAGNYGVVVYDSYGDGGPVFSVTSAGGTLVPATAVAGSQSSATFTVN